MKKLLYLLPFVLFGCAQDLNKENNLDAVIVDTTEVCRNGFGQILGYDVIVRIDSSLYGASVSEGKINGIYRKLKRVKLK